MRLRSPHSAQFTINGLSPDAAFLQEMITDIQISCDAGAGAGYEVCFLGRTGNTQDTLSEDVHSVAFQFVDYKWILDRQLMYTDSVFASAEVAGRAWGWIAAKQAEQEGAMGITDAGVSTGVSKEVTVNAGDSIFDKIDDMADSSPRLEWDILPATKQFRMWTKRGTDLGHVLEYGKTVSAMTRARVVADYANVLFGTGGEGTVPVTKVTAAITAGLEPRGRMEKAVSYSDVVIQGTLDANLTGLLPVTSELSGALNLTLKKGWWRGPSHLWLGDVITYTCRSGRINESSKKRIVEISVAPGDDGEETVRMLVIPDA